MAKKLADYSARPVKSPNSEKWIAGTTATFTDALGAASLNGDAGFSIADSGVGTFNLTFPACPDKTRLHVEIYSPLKTVVGHALTAFDPAAGTATIKTLAGVNAAVDTDPASGDKLMIDLIAEPYKA